MTISSNVNTTSSMQQNSLDRNDLKEIAQDAVNHQNLKPEPVKEEAQIKSYSTFLGTNIDIKV